MEVAPRPKNFGLKNNLSPKTLLVCKNLGVNKKIQVRINFESEKEFGCEIKLVFKKMFGSQKVLGPKIFWVQKKF